MIKETTIAVSGHAGVGKGSAVEILKLLFPDQVVIASTRAIIEAKLAQYGVTDLASRQAKADGFMKIAAAEGGDWIMKAAVKIFEQGNKNILIFDALRMPEQALWLMEHYRPWIVFHAEAPIELCLERVHKRSRKGGLDAKPEEINISLEDFKKAREHPTAVSIDQIGKLPGVTVVENIEIKKFGATIIAHLMTKGLLTAIPESDPRYAQLEAFYRSIEEE